MGKVCCHSNLLTIDLLQSSFTENKTLHCKTADGSNCTKLFLCFSYNQISPVSSISGITTSLHFCIWEDGQVQNLQKCLLCGYCSSKHCYLVNICLGSPTAFTSTVTKASDKASRLHHTSCPSLFLSILIQGLFFLPEQIQNVNIKNHTEIQCPPTVKAAIKKCLL